MSESLKTIVVAQRPTLRDGIPILFSGQEEDENGEPISEWFEQELIVPPLNLDSLRELEKPLSEISEMSPQVALETIYTAIRKALNRNYRNIPIWLLRQNLDVGNMEMFMKALMDINGLHRRDEAEKKARLATEKALGIRPTGT